MTRVELNLQQRAAVAARDGELFVSAGAGSGKTRVLAERFAAMVMAGEQAGRPAGLDRILLITYTDKAAAELSQRVRRVFLEAHRPDLARRVDEAWISTIHGFCARVVRRHSLDLGIDPGFAVIAEPDVGVVRAAAFDQAARLAMQQDEVAKLIAAYSLGAVRAATMSAYDQARAMGRDKDGLRLPATPDLAAAIRQFLAAAPGLEEDLQALTPTATIEKNVGALRGLILVARGVAEQDAEGTNGTSGREAADTLLAAASGIKFGKQGSPEAKELAQSASEMAAALAGEAADTLARDHSMALIGLTRAFAQAYDGMKEARGVLDFEDLQLLTRRLFTSRPRVARRYAGSFDTVMIDEFQDANELQVEALLPVAGEMLCTVGDDKQSIYGFRFADVALFRNRRERLDAQGGPCVALPVNYRSHAELLETFNALFSCEAFFGDDFLRLEAGRTGGWRTAWPDGRPRTEVILVEHDGWDVDWRQAEADALSRRIAEMVADGVAEPGGIVVLLRQMTQSQVYAAALRRVGLEVLVEAGGGFFESREVSDLRALVRVLANPADDEAMLGVLAGGFGAVSDEALCRLAKAPGRLWQAAADTGGAGLSGRDADTVALIHLTVSRLREEQGRRSLADLVLDACRTLGYGADIGDVRTRSAAHANIRKFVRIADQFEASSPGDPGAFLEYLTVRELHTTREKQGSIADGRTGAVRIMSVHAAKGLEFPVVAFADLSHKARARTEPSIVVKGPDGPVLAMKLPTDADGKRLITPSFERLADMDDALGEEEAKRLFYVACTRAEEALIMCGTASLDKPPGDSTAIDRLRHALGSDPEVPRLPNTAVTLIRPAEVEAGEETRVEAGEENGVAVKSAGAVPNTPDAPDTGAALSPLTAPSPDRGLREADTGVGAVPARSAAPGGLAVDDSMAPPTELSFTALAQYEGCPYRFYAQRVLGVGSAASSGEPGPLDVGNAVHAALRLRAALGELSEDRLEAICCRQGLADGERARVRDAVAVFAGTAIAARADHAPWSSPEVPFLVRIGDRALAGSLDLLFREGELAVVVDYKTGRGLLGDDEARERYRRQAECYALAALATGATEAEVHFVEVEREGRTTVFRFGADDAAVIQDGVAAAFARMGAGEYGRRQAFEPHVCRDCPVSGSLCPITPPGRPAASTARTQRRCPPPARP